MTVLILTTRLNVRELKTVGSTGRCDENRSSIEKASRFVGRPELRVVKLLSFDYVLQPPDNLYLTLKAVPGYQLLLLFFRRDLEFIAVR